VWVNFGKIEGLLCKICKTGLRVDFGKTEGLLCKMAGEFRPRIIFQRINSWTRSTSLWTAGRARSTVDRRRRGQRGAGARRCVHRSSASGRFGVPKLAGGGAKGREEHGELGRRCGGWATVVQNREAAALGEDTAQAWRERKRSVGRCGATRGWCSPFIGAGGAPRRGGRAG
jgi:hypothetical protein